MSALAKAHIEAFGWLCEDSLWLRAEAVRDGKHFEAEAYGEAAAIWADRAFKEAQA